MATREGSEPWAQQALLSVAQLAQQPGCSPRRRAGRRTGGGRLVVYNGGWHERLADQKSRPGRLCRAAGVQHGSARSGPLLVVQGHRGRQPPPSPQLPPHDSTGARDGTACCQAPPACISLRILQLSHARRSSPASTPSPALDALDALPLCTAPACSGAPAVRATCPALPEALPSQAAAGPSIDQGPKQITHAYAHGNKPRRHSTATSCVLYEACPEPGIPAGRPTKVCSMMRSAGAPRGAGAAFQRAPARPGALGPGQQFGRAESVCFALLYVRLLQQLRPALCLGAAAAAGARCRANGGSPGRAPLPPADNHTRTSWPSSITHTHSTAALAGCTHSRRPYTQARSNA